MVPQINGTRNSILSLILVSILVLKLRPSFDLFLTNLNQNIQLTIEYSPGNPILFTSFSKIFIFIYVPILQINKAREPGFGSNS